MFNILGKYTHRIIILIIIISYQNIDVCGKICSSSFIDHIKYTNKHKLIKNANYRN